MIASPSGSVALNSPITVPAGWFSEEREYGGGIEIGGCLVQIPQGETEAYTDCGSWVWLDGGLNALMCHYCSTNHPDDSVRAVCLIEWIGLCTRCIGTISIAVHSHTLPCISKKPQGFALYGPHLGLVGIIAMVPIGIRCTNRISPRVRRGRACPAGILPLRFRGQYIGPTIGKVVCLLLIQAGKEYLDIIPGYFFYRAVGLPPIDSVWHLSHQYSPSSPPRTGPA